ncbi:MAG: NAD(P)/FAD-dependent oxidoreductase [candidate division FCPU426 bacterium]
MRIGIVGAGLTGLAAGRALARAGHQVVVAEQAPEPGGLAGTFAYGGTRLEMFYHHIFTTDLETIRFIRDLGLSDRLLWRETPMGIYSQGRLQKFATPWDLLRFRPLSPANRLRFGLCILYLSRVKRWRGYEQVRAKDWILRAFGQQAWDVIWGPLLHGKFGDYANDIGMPWFYSRIHTRAGSREQGMMKESLGYLQGSFQVLHEALAAEITARGGRVRCGESVRSLIVEQGRVAGWRTSRGRERLDAVLATQAPPALWPMLPANLGGDYWDRLRQVEYLGNVCAVLTLKRSLSPIYWMNVPDLASPFIAVIEHTNFIRPETYGGRHVLYLSSYVPTRHPRYRAGDDAVLHEFYAYLSRVVPGFEPSDVLETRVFRAPYAQPVIRTGFGERLVPHPAPLSGLFLANMAQIYPEDRGMSYSLRLGLRVAQDILKYEPPAAVPAARRTARIKIKLKDQGGKARVKSRR